MQEVFSLITRMFLAFGAAFELPVVVFFLALAGIVDAPTLLKGMPYAVLIVFILAAILTPTPDWVSQTLLGVPMVVLYLLGVAAACSSPAASPRPRRRRESGSLTPSADASRSRSRAPPAASTAGRDAHLRAERRAAGSSIVRSTPCSMVGHDAQRLEVERRGIDQREHRERIVQERDVVRLERPAQLVKSFCWTGSQMRTCSAIARATGPARSSRARSGRVAARSASVTSAVTSVVRKPAPSTATEASGSEHRL